MRRQTLLIISLFFLTVAAFGQTKQNCFEIKYLDFFGVEELDTMKFSSSELDQLLITDLAKNEKEKARKTNFLIPFIVMQLKGYYPTCSTNIDTSTFRKLKQLYFKIRQSDISIIKGKSISNQLEYIRQDFYSQVQNDTLLPFMNYTLDDGPFYGQQSKYIPNYKKGTAYTTDFGTLFITKYPNKIFVTVINKQGKHLWTRIMTGNSNRQLTEINLSKENITKTSLGYTIGMFSEGEALKLYLKSNGDFRYYFHSW
jgi:hypothetical protein